MQASPRRRRQPSKALDARRSGEALAVELMRHPGRITEELVTMRVVQTLSIVDLLNYRNHVWRLGEYGEADGSRHPLLDFDEAVLSARIDVE